MSSTKFVSTGAAASRSLKNFLVEKEVARRQMMLDSLMVNRQLAEDARLQAAAQRQTERDRVSDERYSTERQDRLLAQADAKAGQYQTAELARQERDEANKQRSMDKADVAANRYHDAELDRQDREDERAFRASESAAQRASAREIVNAQMRGTGKKADDDSGDRAATVLDALDELSSKINTQEGLTARAGGAWASTMARANYDDDVAEYTAVLEGAVPLIARRMGHTGVLTQADVDSVKAMFPKAGDGKTLRDRKMARIRSLMGGSGGTSSGSSTTTTNDWRDHGNGVRVRRKN